MLSCRLPTAIAFSLLRWRNQDGVHVSTAYKCSSQVTPEHRAMPHFKGRVCSVVPFTQEPPIIFTFFLESILWVQGFCFGLCPYQHPTFLALTASPAPCDRQWSRSPSEQDDGNTSIPFPPQPEEEKKAKWTEESSSLLCWGPQAPQPFKSCSITIQTKKEALPSWQAEQSTSRSSHKTPSALWLKWNFCVQRYHQHHQWSVQKENTMLSHVHLTRTGKLYIQWYPDCLWQFPEQRKTLGNIAKDMKISVSSSMTTIITLTVQKCTNNLICTAHDTTRLQHESWAQVFVYHKNSVPGWGSSWPTQEPGIRNSGEGKVIQDNSASDQRGIYPLTVCYKTWDI